MKDDNHKIAKFLGWIELQSIRAKASDLWVNNSFENIRPDFQENWGQLIEGLNKVREELIALDSIKDLALIRFEIGRYHIVIQYIKNSEDVIIRHSCFDNVGDCKTWKEVFFKTLLDLSSKLNIL